MLLVESYGGSIIKSSRDKEAFPQEENRLVYQP